jgi:hypothetical protein
LASLFITTYQIKKKITDMKKLITMVALAAISLGSVYANGSRVIKMQTDTTKKAKKDTTKKTPPVIRFKK